MITFKTWCEEFLFERKKSRAEKNYNLISRFVINNVKTSILNKDYSDLFIANVEDKVPNSNKREFPYLKNEVRIGIYVKFKNGLLSPTCWGEYSKKFKFLQVIVEMPKDIQTLEKLNISISALHHELVHHFQEIPEHDYPEIDEKEEKVPTEELIKYLTHPREVDAYVRQLYSLSKKLKTSFSDLVNKKIINILSTRATDFSTKNVKEVANVWFNYAIKTFNINIK